MNKSLSIKKKYLSFARTMQYIKYNTNLQHTLSLSKYIYIYINTSNYIRDWIEEQCPNTLVPISKPKWFSKIDPLPENRENSNELTRVFNIKVQGPISMEIFDKLDDEKIPRSPSLPPPILTIQRPSLFSLLPLSLSPLFLLISISIVDITRER